jgi:hypothetical protein
MADSNFSIAGVVEKVVGTLAANFIVWGMPPVLAYLKSKSFCPWGIVLDTIVGWVYLYVLFYGLSAEGTTSFTWWMSLVGGVLLVLFLILDRVRNKQMPSPAPSVKAEGDGPVCFGAPVQRWKRDETISHWCVPIKIDVGKIKDSNSEKRYLCQLYLDGYSDGKSSKGKDGIELCVGDVGLGKVTEEVNLGVGRVYLIPVAWRSEEGGDRNGYITDGRFFQNPRQCEYPVFPNRNKQYYHLRVKSAFFGEHSSPHFYFLRVPTTASNGHFVLEMEHK